MAVDAADIGVADRGRQAVALGDLLDQAGIGSRQIFDGDIIGSGFGEIVFDPRIGGLTTRCVGRRADELAAAVEDQNLKVRCGLTVGLAPFQQQRNIVARSLSVDGDGLQNAAVEILGVGEMRASNGAGQR